MEIQETTRPMGKTINSETQTAVKEESLSSSMGSIYCITSPSGKQYIGQTKNTIEYRFRTHQNPSSKCDALKNAGNKYGWENMTIKLIEKCPRDKLDEREIYYISLMGTYSPAGYNLTLGGSGNKKCWYSFEEALKLIRNMKFNGTKELEEYLLSDKKHPKIPSHPDRTYNGNGWINFTHFIGNGEENRGKNGWRDFILAREFVHSLGFTREWQWDEYCKSSNIPDDIPKTPRTVYKNAGFIDMGDWMGSGRKAKGQEEWLSYEKAQKIVVKFAFSQPKKYVEWHHETRPLNIPVCPYTIYKNKGWRGWTHYLGENRVPSKRKSKMRPFEEARTYARSLGIKSGNQWQRKYWKTHKKPADIPLHPDRIYKEWKGWKDFLGN